jgi:hypothetical protein
MSLNALLAKLRIPYNLLCSDKPLGTEVAYVGGCVEADK